MSGSSRPPADIAPFVDVLLNGSSDPTALCAANTNGDASVYGRDVGAMIDILVGP